MASLRDEFPPRPNAFGDAAAAQTNPAVRVIGPAPGSPIPGGTAVSGMTATELPATSAAPVRPGIGAFDSMRASMAPGAPATVPPPATPLQSVAQQLGQRPTLSSPADPAFHGDGRYAPRPTPRRARPPRPPLRRPPQYPAGALALHSRARAWAVLPTPLAVPAARCCARVPPSQVSPARSIHWTTSITVTAITLPIASERSPL